MMLITLVFIHWWKKLRRRKKLKPENVTHTRHGKLLPAMMIVTKSKIMANWLMTIQRNAKVCTNFWPVLYIKGMFISFEDYPQYKDVSKKMCLKMKPNVLAFSSFFIEGYFFLVEDYRTAFFSLLVFHNWSLRPYLDIWILHPGSDCFSYLLRMSSK